MTKLLYRIYENSTEKVTASWKEACDAEKRGATVVKFFESVSDAIVDEVRREKILKKFGYK